MVLSEEVLNEMLDKHVLAGAIKKVRLEGYTVYQNQRVGGWRNNNRVFVGTVKRTR